MTNYEKYKDELIESEYGDYRCSACGIEWMLDDQKKER